MPKYRWLLILTAALLVGVLFVALNQVRQSRGQGPVVRYIPAAADVDPVEFMLPEQRNPPKTSTEIPVAAPAAPAPTAEPACPPPPCAPVTVQCVPEPLTQLEPEPAPEPPPPPPRVWPTVGPQIPEAIIHAIAVEDQSFLGYRPNDLVIGRVIDNRANFQRGLFAGFRAGLSALLAMLEPKSSPVASRIEAGLVQGNLEKWWFPSAEKTIGQGIKDLRELAADITDGKIRLTASDKNLARLIQVNADFLAGAQAEVTAPGIGFFESDDRFYHAQGTAVAARATLDAAALSFKTAAAEAGATKDLDEARQWIGKAARMDPIMVLSGAPGEYTSNHLLIMAYFLERAEDALRSAQAKLEQG